MSEKATGEDTRAKAVALALRIIGTRSVSRKELYDKLTGKGISESDAETAINRMSELGYLNDADYAERVAKHYSARGYGPARIKSELYRRGLQRELSDEISAGLPDQSDRLVAMLRSKLKCGSYSGKDIKRAASALYRRGFSRDDINTALDKLKPEIEELQ